MRKTALTAPMMNSTVALVSAFEKKTSVTGSGTVQMEEMSVNV